MAFIYYKIFFKDDEVACGNFSLEAMVCFLWHMQGRSGNTELPVLYVVSAVKGCTMSGVKSLSL